MSKSFQKKCLGCSQIDSLLRCIAHTIYVTIVGKLVNFSFSSINAQLQQTMKAQAHTDTHTYTRTYTETIQQQRYGESLLALPHACPLRCNGALSTTRNAFCRGTVAICNKLQSLIPRASLHTSTSCMSGALVCACTSVRS